jgi:hypothetical protein
LPRLTRPPSFLEEALRGGQRVELAIGDGAPRLSNVVKMDG